MTYQFMIAPPGTATRPPLLPRPRHSPPLQPKGGKPGLGRHRRLEDASWPSPGSTRHAAPSTWGRQGSPAKSQRGRPTHLKRKQLPPHPIPPTAKMGPPRGPPRGRRKAFDRSIRRCPALLQGQPDHSLAHAPGFHKERKLPRSAAYLAMRIRTDRGLELRRRNRRQGHQPQPSHFDARETDPHSAGSKL